MFVLVVAPLLTLAACPEPKEFDGLIAVYQNPHRLDLIPGRARDAGAPAASAAARPARAHVMKSGEGLGGPSASGRAGDYILENDEVVFVIAQLDPGASAEKRGGAIVDAADARVRKDEIGRVETSLGPAHVLVYDALTGGQDESGGAWASVRGHDRDDPRLAIVTRYALNAPDRALLITTTLTNGSDVAIDALTLGDRIEWGGAHRFAPGMSVGFVGASHSEYLGGIGQAASYGITSTEDTIDATSVDTRSDTSIASHATIAAGASLSYARVLVVGLRGDVASVVAEIRHAMGADLGALEISLVDETGHAVTADASSKVVLSLPGGGGAVLSIRAGSAPPFGGEVPPGTYVASYAAGGGRLARGANPTVVVKANEVATVTLTVGLPGARECEAGAPF